MNITLKTSDGTSVTLAVDGWPTQASMDWVCMVDGEPTRVTATLALEWKARPDAAERVWCEVAWSSTEAFEGDTLGPALLDDENEVRIYEWGDTFCQDVNRALADVEALKSFADLEQARLDAARLLDRAWRAIPHRCSETLPTPVADLYDERPTFAGYALMCHVYDLVTTAEKACSRRAAARFEADGEHMPGSEVTNLRSVPPQVLEQADHEIREQDGGWCDAISGLGVRCAGIPGHAGLHHAGGREWAGSL